MTSSTTAEANRALISNVMTATFIRRDFASVAKYFSPNYKQHTPRFRTDRKQFRLC
jgi:predicted SnoaL-like aldol condensation-catalyzing enzyme